MAHVGEVLAVAEQGAEGDEQHIGEWMHHASHDPRIEQAGEELLEAQDVWKLGSFGNR